MRKKLNIALAILLCIGLAACATEPEATTVPQSTADVPAEPFEITFDPEREDLPNRTTAEQITEGMYISEVYAIMGLPQKGHTHNSSCKELMWPLEKWEQLIVLARKQADTGAWYVADMGIYFDVVVDPNRVDLPSRAAAEQIKDGMRINEVYSVMGVPHRQQGSGAGYLIWDLDTGEELVLSATGEYHPDTLTDMIYVYGVQIR